MAGYILIEVCTEVDLAGGTGNLEDTRHHAVVIRAFNRLYVSEDVDYMESAHHTTTIRGQIVGILP